MATSHPYIVKSTPHIVAVHKPAGMPFHSVNSDTGQGLLAALKATCSVPADRLYAVHRLDTGTSGLVLFGTSSHVAGLLSQAFRERKVHKYYVALAAGKKPLRKQGSIIGDMAKSRDSKWKLLRSRTDPAVTRFWSTSLAAVQPGLRLYLLKPETGRTHQLRVAMKSNSSAIAGDLLYGSAMPAATARQQQLDSQQWSYDRMYLHAAAIRVQLPGELNSSDTEHSSGTAVSQGQGCSWFQAVDLPSEGLLYQHPVVQQTMVELLRPDLEDDFGVWFADNKLMMSVAEHR